MTLNTRERILDAFFALAEQHPARSRFTFTEIAKEAGLSRQAIYKRHFNSADEIIDYIRKELTSEFSPLYDSYDAALEPDPFIFFAQTVIPAIYKQHKRIRILYTAAIDPFWREFITSIYREWVAQNLQLNHQKLGIPPEMADTLLAQWLNSLIENWIIEEEPIPSQQFSEIFLNLVSSPLTSFAIYDSKVRSSNKIVIAKPIRRNPEK
ncbi:TetR family transcriptional regulator [Streptococcus sp. DD11]|uniref:TetR/AcrR family transcriptional regulator n=1 Tax=Streptococcus sp. DD11 TaxID=1777879 RepID=UPI000791A255|nr:TetR/AcrR family transcriptional regulator [Streptococcus sp. DD11]KXT83111.1 TetR family transcriptional regulator [Streptococcus sp. DD11]